jgi:hypothetical protein
VLAPLTLCVQRREFFNNDNDDEDGRLDEGVYRRQALNFGTFYPALLRALVPDGALELTEESWENFPYRRAVYKSPLLGPERFHVEVETLFVDDDRGENPNALMLSDDCLRVRQVDVVDLVHYGKTGCVLEVRH